MKVTKYLLWMVILFWSTVFGLPKQELVPGGIAIVPLKGQYHQAPDVTYQDYRVLVAQQNQQWVAVVGIPLDTPAGKQTIMINGHESQTFMVQSKEYPAQYVTLKNKRMVNPNPVDLLRIKKEKPQIQAVLAHWRADNHVETNFIWPVTGRVGGEFGVRRFFNNEPRTPHSGVDIMVPEGTPIKAAANGIARGVGNYFFNGNTVFIDHGQGLITMYCHLQKITVHDGELVQQGEVIGTVGQTGRATGPHLHWTVSINNTRVDPLLFVGKNVK